MNNKTTLKHKNPTKTKAWSNLENHFKETQGFNIKQAFYDDKNRRNKYCINTDAISFDFSKNKLSDKTLELLISLANEMNLKESITSCFDGYKINETENRAVLHTALRTDSETEIKVDGKDVNKQIKSSLRKISAFSNKVISGKWRGYTEKKITDIVNIGIGGSDLGVKVGVNSLQFYKNHLNTHFISNIDGDHVSEILKKVNPETTLFVIVSKSFTTQETIYNAETIKNWFLQQASVFDVSKHFVAISANTKAVENFGIDKKNIFPMWEWVGGRFSLWSAVGLSISLAIGFRNFKLLLDGAKELDEHFKEADLDKNIPVILALISVWYNNFYQYETELVIPYTKYLSEFPSYLQQLLMESNGKSVDKDGEPVNYQTGAIVWGSEGTNAQHAFMQLVHQGTKVIPTDFIGFKQPLHSLNDHHKILMANYKAQIDALAFGKTKEEVHLDLKVSGKENDINKLLPFKVFEGNKPSNSLLFDKLTPKTLGMLLAIYEHKVFVQGIIWNINSFDQFGVELGKELVSKILKRN